MADLGEWISIYSMAYGNRKKGLQRFSEKKNDIMSLRQKKNISEQCLLVKNFHLPTSVILCVSE